MGMYDEITVRCPNCKTINILQSKAGDCTLRLYTLKNAPMEILGDISKKDILCEHCDRPFHIRVQYVVTTEIGTSSENEENYDD